MTGFQEILRLVEDLGIVCMLDHGHPHVVYAEDPAQATELEKEAEVV